MRRSGRRRAAVDEEACHLVQEAVAGRPRYGPLGRQRFAIGQNLLGHDIQRRPRGLLAVPAGIIGHPAEAIEVLVRIEQAVGMIHTQSGDVACRHKFLQEPVSSVEDLRLFHPQRRRASLTSKKRR